MTLVLTLVILGNWSTMEGNMGAIGAVTRVTTDAVTGAITGVTTGVTTGAVTGAITGVTTGAVTGVTTGSAGNSSRFKTAGARARTTSGRGS
jgi:hypothetical protein